MLLLPTLIAFIGVISTRGGILATVPETPCVLRDPLPKKHCGDRGYIKHGQPVGFHPLSYLASSQRDCINLCMRRRGNSLKHKERSRCQNFGYNETSGLCDIYSLSFAKPPHHPDAHALGFVADDSSDTLYWSAECFLCRGYCPTSPGLTFAQIDAGGEQLDAANLLDNPGFELSNKAATSGPWKPVEPNPSMPDNLIVSPGRNSANAYHLVAAAYRYDVEPSLEQSFRPCPGRLHVIKVDYKFDEGEDSGYLKCVFGNTAMFRDPVEPGVWHSYESSIGYSRRGPNHTNGVPATDTLYCGDQDGEASVTLDNFVVVPLATPVASKPGTEVLNNGGFETDGLKGWLAEVSRDKYGATGLVSPGIPPRSGEPSKFAYQASVNYTAAGSIGQLSQNFTLVPGRRYVMSFDSVLSGKFDGYFPSEVHVEIGRREDPNTSAGKEFGWIANLKDLGRTYERTFVAEQVENEIRLLLYAFNGEHPRCAITVDNISLKEVAD